VEHDEVPAPHDVDPRSIKIRRILAKNGLSDLDGKVGQLDNFVDLLLKWNKRINLISRKDTQNIWEAHILHSLSLVLGAPIPPTAKVLDLGTGGGLPGIPMKIVRTDISLVMLDSTRKKIEAVRDMVETLGLQETTAEWGRAEDKAMQKKFRESFDVVVARGVAPLDELAAWSCSLVKRNQGKESRLVALKGGDVGPELERTRRLRSVREVSAKALTFYGAEVIPGVNKQIVSVWFS